jgi:hypothetical protein
MMEKPLLVEVIAYAPTAYYHCTHCEVAWREMGVTDEFHNEQTSTSLPEDLLQEYQKLSDWVRKTTQQHCDNVLIKVIDAASLEGFIKSLRYRVRRYPAAIVNHHARFSGGDFARVNEEIERQLSARNPARTRL